MPKSKPTHTVVHRIEFQESERRMLEVALAAYSVDKVSESISQLTTLIITIFGVVVIEDKWDELVAAYQRFRMEGQAGAAYDPQGTMTAEEREAQYRENAGNFGLGGLTNLINNLLDGIFRNPIYGRE